MVKLLARILPPVPGRRSRGLAGLVLAALVASQGGPAAAGQFSSRVSLVEVYATVTDASGRLVKGLRAEDFTVDEDGAPQAIQAFSYGEFPLTVAVGIDRSFSMSDQALLAAAGATRGFAERLEPDDQLMVLGIGSQTEVLSPLSTDRVRARQSLERLERWGTTPLYDAVIQAIDAVQPAPGRRALIMLSDGDDRYSRATAADVVAYARQHDVLVYPVSLGKARVPVWAEVATVSGGLQKSPARLAVEGRDAKFLRVANVLRLGLDLTDVHSVPISDAERGRVLLKPGDLLVVEGNGSLDELGRAAQWRGEVGDWTHQNHLIRVRPGVQLEPDFLEQIWASPQVRSQIRDVGASTSGLHTLSTKKVGAVRIPVPARSSQRRLADAAATLLQTRRVLLGHATRIGQSISALERSLLSAATTGRLVPQDPSDEPAELLLRRLEAEREAAAAESKPAVAPVIDASRLQGSNKPYDFEKLTPLRRFSSDVRLHPSTNSDVGVRLRPPLWPRHSRPARVSHFGNRESCFRSRQSELPGGSPRRTPTSCTSATGRGGCSCSTRRARAWPS